ncbi:MAG: hypothetical protein ACKOXB_13245 [Flavobacteriales bacterium]
MDNRKERIKCCSHCNNSFSCFTKDCWCAELPLVMPLKTDGGNCLCPDCLKKAIEDKTGAILP